MNDEAFNYREFLQSVSVLPGVYQMLDEHDKVIYVGKAKNLKKRLSSYFTKAHNNKTHALVNRICDIRTTVTHTESEALLLEDTLIKKYQPRYNVLLRDDKSYPYIYISTQQQYPKISLYRGKIKNRKGKFYGPYPNSGAVRQTIHLIHKLFRLRQCNESYFKNRSRPCLQYQIKRCSAPCTGQISEDDYARDIAHTDLFLRGKTQTVIDDLVKRMEDAATRMAYEEAAIYRDQINDLNYILEKQYVSGTTRLNVDVIACAVKAGQCCIQVFYFRDGTSHGNKAFFPRVPDSDEPIANILEAFISQFYLANEIPRELIVSAEPNNKALLQNVLSERAQRKVEIKSSIRGDRSKWLSQAQQNADDALEIKLASHTSQIKRLEDLRQMFRLDEQPKRIECFDISHAQGDNTVASCVVFNEQGPLKADYRRFNIKDITPGDDYAAISQAFERRYSRVLKESGAIPDIILIDGGKGQLAAASEIAETLFSDQGPMIVGVSKGPARKPGMEQLHIRGKSSPLQPGHQSAALLLIQQIRDEAHRFAITGHRQKSRKKVIHSSLEDIPGLGPKRRHQLIQYFGGIHGINRAGIEDLQRIKGISRALATRIYEHLHSH
jgi:excinuclease ABC subunit C